MIIILVRIHADLSRSAHFDAVPRFFTAPGARWIAARHPDRSWHVRPGRRAWHQHARSRLRARRRGMAGLFDGGGHLNAIPGNAGSASAIAGRVVQSARVPGRIQVTWRILVSFLGSLILAAGFGLA